MKIVAFEGQGGPRIGVVERDQVVDLQAVEPKVPNDLGDWLAKTNGDTKQLGEIAKANPEVAIGNHPFFDPQHGANTNVVLRASDARKLAQAKRAVEDMLQRVRRAQSG